MKEWVKKILKNSRFGRVVYEPIHKLYRMWAIPRRRRILKKNGPAVLKRLEDVFERHGIPAFATYGTMLGFVRDHGFIPHDDDMDMGVMPGEWTPQRLMRVLLEQEEGFRLLFIFKFRERVIEFKVECMGVPVDFFFYEDTGKEFLCPLCFFYPDMKYPAPNANSMRVVHSPRFEGITRIPIFGFEFPVMGNYKQMLVALYGKDWNIPDKKWTNDKRPHIEDIDELGYSISLEEAMALEN